MNKPVLRKFIQNFNAKSRIAEPDPASVEAGLNAIGDVLSKHSPPGHSATEEKPDEYEIPENPMTAGNTSHEDQAIALTEREAQEYLNAREKTLDQKEREARDRRSQLLKAVKVSAPEINGRLVETFERLSVENHAFAQKELVRLFQNDAQLQSTLDFFDLSLAQREDLLDRIGFYKGIVIDHSMSNPVETGFREVLRREVKEGEDEEQAKTAVATLLYRKPNFSGYFENHYSTSESYHQVQKNGVTDIKSSLTVAGGKVSSVGVGVSGAYYDSDGSNKGGLKKKLYITSNFFLPKVELSFDASVPCASAEFEEACLEALAEASEEAQFKAIIKVLASFGQFVAMQTLVGGRLFATDVKEFEGTESESEMVNRYAGRIKVAADSVSASFESDTSVEKGKQENNRDKDLKEKQSYTIHAVDGEGAVVEQAGRWAESLYEYQRWSAVQRERLVPSIDLLSKSTRDSVLDVLKSFAAKHSAMHLVGQYRAYFLFYGDYDMHVGQLTKRDFVLLKNTNSGKCLAIRGETPQAGEVTARPFEWARQLIWRITPNGNIVSVIPIVSGFPGQRRNVEYALTAVGQIPKESEKHPDTFKVILAELSSDRNQVWNFTGGGELRNAAFGGKYALSMPLNDNPVLKLRNEATDNTLVWSVQEATPEDLNKMDAVKLYGRLRHPSGLVLSIEGCEDSDTEFTMSDRRRVVLQRDVGGKHQLWYKNADGILISAISISGVAIGESTDVCLVHYPDTLIVAQSLGLKSTAYHCGENAQIYATEAGKIFYPGGEVAAETSGQRIKSVSNPDLGVKFEQSKADFRPVGLAVSVPKAGISHYYRITTVDKRELKVDGYLTGIEFIGEERGQGRLSAREYFRMRMRLTVTHKNGASNEPVEFKDEPDDKLVDRDELGEIDNRYVQVDERFLMLPDEPIYSLRLSTHDNGKDPRRLAFSYRLKADGPWIGLASTNDKMTELKLDNLGIFTGFDSLAGNGNKIIGIGLDYDQFARRIRPKFLRRLTG